MRIAQLSLHASPLAPPGGKDVGGMQVYVLELSRELARLGYEVDMFTRRDSGLPAIEPVERNLRLIRIDAGPPESVDKEAQVAYLPELIRNMRPYFCGEGPGYDVLHSHYWQSGRAGMILARETGLPHVTMFHTLGEVKNRARISEREPRARIHHERRIARGVDAIVTASEHEQVLLERHYGAHRDRMVTIPCGVDVTRFYPHDQATSRGRLGLPQEGAVLLWVGRLEKLKGVDILVSAAAQLETREFTLVIVGGEGPGGELRAQLTAQAEAEGIAANVRFTGAVAHDDLPYYYSAADVCVVPSYYESFGLVALEAMACGTPVIASRVGGLVSTVEDGVNGFLIPWRCPEPFADKLEILLGNANLRANFSRSAERSVRRFGWRPIALQIADLYDRVRSHRDRSDLPDAPFGKEAYEAAVIAGGYR